MPDLYGLTARDKTRVGQAVLAHEQSVGKGQKWAVNQPGQGRYYFGVSKKDADEVSIAAGKVINGTAVSTIAAADHTIGTTNGTYYLYIEIWYNAGWQSNYASGTTYPTQAVKSDAGTDYQCLRVLIAEVTVADNVVNGIIPVWPGQEIINPYAFAVVTDMKLNASNDLQTKTVGHPQQDQDWITVTDWTTTDCT